MFTRNALNFIKYEYLFNVLLLSFINLQSINTQMKYSSKQNVYSEGNE